MDESRSKKSYSTSSSSRHKQKKKKHHKKKKRETKSSSSESGSDEMEWVEAPAKPKTDAEPTESPKAENKRDDWMSEEMFVATLSKEDMKQGSSRQKKLEAAMKEKEKNDAIQKSRELNPHMKNNGSGLPEDSTSAQNLALPSISVGDGGYSYLKKAYYRIQEQSQQESRSMEEIAVERWGSLDKLTALIDEAEKRMKENSRNKYSSQKDKWHDKSEKKYADFRRPRDRSRSNSPKRSHQYQKPKDRSSRDKKLGQFKSSDQKRHRKYDDDIKYDSDDDINYENEDAKDRRRSDVEENKDIFVWDRKHASRDRNESYSRNKFRSSTEDKSPKWNREQSPGQEYVPAWKKVKPSGVKENTTKQREEDVCEEMSLKNVPRWQKGSDSSSSASSIKKEDSYQSERSTTREELPTILSEDEINKLAAKCTKAELMGDKALASTLKKQLEEAREALKSGGSMNTTKRDKERVMLTKMDSSGQERPIQYSHDVSQSQSKQMKKQSQKFFDDGSRYSLKQMFEREKLTTADDNLEMFMEVAAKSQEADDENETSGISKKATNKMSHHLQEEKDVGKAILQHQKRSSAIEKCCYCLDQPHMKRHLIIQKFELVYLSIPEFASIVDGHCLIVPKRHVSSFLALDEEEWKEVEDLKRKLRNVFQAENKDIITLETSRSFRYYPHAYLEVIPVPVDISDMAPIYFKKAILESETEWANNVKLIDLNKKNLRHSVPKNLPYFWVEFNPKVHSGFAHVIEDEKSFERNFGKEVVGGMLDIDYNYLFKNRKEDPSKKSKETVKFIKMWENFNGNDS